MTPTIRPETPADPEAVRDVHRLAFGQDDEAGIVDALRAGGHARVSLVAEVGGRVVGHVLFSDLPVLTAAGTVPALSLAPMAVRPEFQRQGVGSALVRAGLDACRAAGHRIVIVLGHPAFYPRFGFSAQLAERLANPFHGGEAWMAAELVPGALAGVAGWACYPPPFGFHPPRLPLREVAGRFAVCRLPAGSPVPAWATAGDVFSVTRTADELSVVCREDLVPEGTQAERGWRGLRVAGAMPFTLAGVLASLTEPVARAGVGVFAVSMFDTDYLLVKAERFAEAVAALRGTGHTVEGIPGTAADRVRLRPVEPGDLPRIFEMHADPDSNRMAAVVPRTREEFDAHWATVLTDPTVTARVILVGDGFAGLVSRFTRDGEAHVGYWIDKPHWGRGVASRALQLLLEEVTARPLFATAAASNGASLRILQKCGFVVEEVRQSVTTNRYPACEEAVLVLR